jgi:hypothetical protein
LEEIISDEMLKQFLPNLETISFSTNLTSEKMNLEPLDIYYARVLPTEEFLYLFWALRR